MKGSINQGVVNRIVQSWARSASGQAVIKGLVGKYRESGVASGVSFSGGAPITEAEMIAAANLLKDLIIRFGAGSSMPKSLIDDISNISVSAPVQAGNQYTITLSFEGNLSRPSLVPSQYGGVDNIIALFNNGYSAGHVVAGEYLDLGKITSRKSFPGSHFVNRAVDAFNSMYGEQYNAHAEAGAAYH